MKTLSPTMVTLSWCQDAAEFYFSHLSHLPWTILLHSGYVGYPHSHFDIVVAEPIRTLTTFGKETIVSENEECTTTTDDPLQILQQMLNCADIRPMYNEDLPFQGDALGLSGYGLGRRFESLPKIAQQDIILPDMAMGIYDRVLVVDHQRQTVSLLSHNDINACRAQPENQQFSPQEDFTFTSDWRSNMVHEQYGEKPRQVQEHLHNSDCYQVNLAQRSYVTYSGDEWQTFLQLNQANHAPFSALLRFEQDAILGLSLERFTLCDNSGIQTRPVRDALPRLPDPQEDSKQTEKLTNLVEDRVKNLMIVDLVRSDIGHITATDSIKVPEFFVMEPLPVMYHLASIITTQLPKQLHASNLLRATFPGGSITGVPKVRAMEIIDELEPHQRNVWHGSIGYLSLCGNMDTNITIRTLTAINEQIHCSAGGGIIADSQEEVKYQETFDKVNKILCQLEKQDAEYRGLTPDDFLSHFQLLRPQINRETLNHRQAVVLISIVRRPQSGLLLTQRSIHLRKHAGQVAFPGGVADDTGASTIAVTLREAEEEVAIPPSVVEVIGILPPVDGVTSYQVVPAVGITPPDLPYRTSEGGVSTVFEMPFAQASHLGRYHSLDIYRRGGSHQVQLSWYEQYFVWGMTTDIIHELALQISVKP